MLFHATFTPPTWAWVFNLGSPCWLGRGRLENCQCVRAVVPRNVYIATASLTDREYPSTGSDPFKLEEEGGESTCSARRYPFR